MPKKATEREPRVRIVLVDDHPLWRQTLRGLLERSGTSEVVAEVADGLAALTAVADTRPDVVLMDVDIPELDGLEATRRILSQPSAPRVLVLSSSSARDQVRTAARAGASGYLVKTVSPDDIVSAVRRVHAGELVFPGPLADVIREELRAGPDVATAQSVRAMVLGGTVLEREGLVKVLRDRGVDARAAADGGDSLNGADVVIGFVGSEKDHDVLHALRERRPSLGVAMVLTTGDMRVVQTRRLPGDGGVAYVRAAGLTDGDEVASVVARVFAGSVAVDPVIARELLGRAQAEERTAGLTERERAVLAQMARGCSNAAIGEAMSLSPKTVETHAAAIFTKLGLESTGDQNRRVLAVLRYLGAEG
jgi:DNA-binding NarL/FixJ family response regulator